MPGAVMQEKFTICTMPRPKRTMRGTESQMPEQKDNIICFYKFYCTISHDKTKSA